jgi:ABC-type multidrug transport system ATPase subunit/pSer/pThr/pTyr-binding forkhead associated (FHA) protein
MKIVLAEQLGNGSSGPERSFDQSIVRIGRDPGECDIAFESSVYPMVSRRHAELQSSAGKWFITDLNSSYGTFLNGTRISGTQPIGVGSLLQFGESGPIMRVVWFELPAEPVQAARGDVAIKDPFAAKTPVQAVSAVQSPPPPAAAAPARFEFAGGNSPRTPVNLSERDIWLGRDTACEISFEASVVMVSRKHARVTFRNGDYLIEDNNSFNGTLVNEQRISSPTPLYDGDEVRLGIGGPVLRFASPARVAPKGASLPGQRSIAIGQIGASYAAQAVPSKTMVFQLEKPEDLSRGRDLAEPQLLMSLSFGDKKELTIGRDDRNDIKLDGLQISNRHARLTRSGTSIVIEDLNSTNGVYINGNRATRNAIGPDDRIQIGSFLIKVDAASNVGVFDTRSKTRVDAVGLTKDVRDRFGGGKIRVLDGISLSIQPNEFVGLLGPSGAGKSMLMDAMNGMRPASVGNVFINGLDLYRHLDQLKQSIGYVPQDDIIHRELTVYRTLYYVAKLRLSRDVSAREIDQTVNEVLDVTGLAERRNVRVDKLSGGQRKRVSIAVELITKPSVIFLDEPTSGLDPATEEKIMKLFRQIAESGRTVIMTTHAMENVKLFDKIVVMMRGKLVFYGKPDEALKHLQAASFKELFDKLEDPVRRGIESQGESYRKPITEQAAEDWKQKFLKTPEFKKHVEIPLKEVGTSASKNNRKKRRLGLFGAIRQTFTLSRRYLEVLFKDKLNLFILFAQAPIIAILTFMVMGSERPRDFVYFVLALVASWFGTSVSAREIIRERPVYSRERMVNLGIIPYLASKLIVLGMIVSLQCLMLFVPLKFFDVTGLMSMPGETFGIPQFWAMLLTSAVGLGLGLFISALVRTSEMATSLVPLILIPQILFSGLVGVPGGVEKVVGLTMPAAWSFDTIKRFSTLDTLEPEGAEPNGKTAGLGLYKYTETENDKIIADARKSINDYQKSAEEKFRQYDDDIRSGKNPPSPRPDEPPAIPNPHKISQDLSRYITFLNPWMNEVLNQIVLMLMFGILVIATLIILRLKDIR